MLTDSPQGKCTLYSKVQYEQGLQSYMVSPNTNTDVTLYCQDALIRVWVNTKREWTMQC